MKIKPTPILSALLLCAVAGNLPPAKADKHAVETAEASVKQFEKSAGTSNPSYVPQLMYLARTYLSNGMDKEAEITFNKAVTSCKAQNDGKNRLPGLMLEWANNLAFQRSPENLKRADNLLVEGITLANALPATSKERLRFMIGTVSFYKSQGKKVQEQERLKAIDEHLLALEKNPKLDNAEITEVAYSLVQLSGVYCPAPPFHALRMLPPVQVVADDSPDKPNTVKAKDFKAAEAWQLRAIAQYDRLPETVPWRIEAHRTLVMWYRHFGQTKQEALQTEQLAKLMHTTDRAKLFPQPAPCPACGMG